jgi:inorganic pyrophosphatase
VDLSWLGATVEVTIDRPLGSIHPTQDDIVYLLNYGFIADTVAGDGEPVDAYVVGTSTPIESAVGRVVAVVSAGTMSRTNSSSQYPVPSRGRSRSWP